MPTKQPFTPAGVTAKTTELYALSDSLLAAEADAVASDFRSWVNANFTLSTPQSAFLAGINDYAARYYGSQCSVAFIARLTVALSVGVEPFPPSIKWVLSESTLVVETNSAGDLKTTGSLTFKIEYTV